MHIHTGKSRINDNDSPEVKQLKGQVEKLERQMEELKRRLPLAPVALKPDVSVAK